MDSLAGPLAEERHAIAKFEGKEKARSLLQFLLAAPKITKLSPGRKAAVRPRALRGDQVRSVIPPAAMVRAGHSRQ
jgi:hypothetical protein